MTSKPSYKQIRITEDSYTIIHRLSTKFGTSLLETVEKISNFVYTNNFSMGELLRIDSNSSPHEKILDRIDNAIAIIKNIEREKIDKISKGLVRVETDTTKILSNMELNISVDSNIIVQNNNEVLEDKLQNNEDLSSAINSIKIEKELSDIRLNEAIEILKICSKTATVSSSGRKKILQEEQLSIIETFIKKCTLQ